MAQITNELWNAIEEELAKPCACEHFQLGEHKITVQRVRKSESVPCLAVFIDDKIKGSWSLDKEENKPSCLEKVWRKRTRALYNSKTIKDVEKGLGKRKAKERFPDLYDKAHWYVPDFSTAKSLVRQFKRIEGLTYITEPR